MVSVVCVSLLRFRFRFRLILLRFYFSLVSFCFFLLLFCCPVMVERTYHNFLIIILYFLCFIPCSVLVCLFVNINMAIFLYVYSTFFFRWRIRLLEQSENELKPYRINNSVRGLFAKDIAHHILFEHRKLYCFFVWITKCWFQINVAAGWKPFLDACLPILKVKLLLKNEMVEKNTEVFLIVRKKAHDILGMSC